MRPLAPERDDDPQDLLRVMDRLPGELSLERGLERPNHLLVELVILICLVAEVGREHQERVPGIVHDRLGHQAQIADPGPVRRDRGLVGDLQGRRGRVQVRSAANAADPRGDDQHVLGIAPE